MSWIIPVPFARKWLDSKFDGITNELNKILNLIKLKSLNLRKIKTFKGLPIKKSELKGAISRYPVVKGISINFYLIFLSMSEVNATATLENLIVQSVVQKLCIPCISKLPLVRKLILMKSVFLMNWTVWLTVMGFH